MAVAMAEGLTINSVTSPPQFRRNNPECRSAPKTPSVLSSPTFALSKTSISVSGGNPVEHRHITQRAPNSRWRTRALASTILEEAVAEAKRAIDEVLMSKGGDGAGGLAEVSWALYADRETKKFLEEAVAKLSACRGQDFGEFLRSVDSQGVWEVFYAPHIAALSSAVRTQVRPLQYVLTDVGFSSNVRYFSPLGEGWLSAAGDYVVRDGRTVEILFDSFWADAGRDNLQPEPKGKGGIERTLVNLAGKGAFISSLSVYPVYYADADVTEGERMAAKKRLDVVRLGSVAYPQASELQSLLVEKRRAGAISNTVLSLQHPPTFTVGKRNTLHNLLATPATLASLGAEVHISERGGDITFHGPHQAVLYPIIALNEMNLGARRYVEGLEDTMIKAAAIYGVEAKGRFKKRTGIWVEDRKLGAIGVRISSGNISSHGLAFNIDPNLEFFSHIVPCGIPDKEVTSLRKESSLPLPDEEVVTEQLIDCFVEVFNFEKHCCELDEIGA